MANLGVGAGATVTAQMDADFFLGLVGNKTIVLDVGRRCEAEIVDNNHVKIHDGTIVSQGRYLHIPANTFDVFEIETGTQGTERYDILAYRIFKENGEEKSEMFIQKDVGEQGNLETPLLRDGAEETYVLMYKAKMEGINLVELIPLYDKKLPTLTDIHESMKMFEINVSSKLFKLAMATKININPYKGNSDYDITIVENESYYYPELGIAVVNARIKQNYKKACSVNYEELLTFGSVNVLPTMKYVPATVIVYGNYTRRYSGKISDTGLITARTNTTYNPIKGAEYAFYISAVYTIKKEG